MQDKQCKNQDREHENNTSWGIFKLHSASQQMWAAMWSYEMQSLLKTTTKNLLEQIKSFVSKELFNCG